ncbi:MULTISPECIES: hypothetical protein [unclassified Streptomyces]|uniref:hypothetical protein n=1 Tax=Streptomycetaceae TaxID=2062 RepID=UPI002E767AB2|nr:MULTISPECIES: hypothetical protein [unclassified Streptomyces]MED7954950.1 hypothetical protein [Streptomyces sp. BE303]MEE1827959.1 hypothetical protein [Streptomyces sp. BE20]
MDLLTYKALDTGPEAPAHPSLAHRAWHGLLGLSPTAVVLLVGLSLGLGAVGAQVTSLPWLIVFSVIWGVTVIALVGVVARWRTPGRGRHRMAT